MTAPSEPTDAPARWGLAARTLHWLVAAGVVFQLVTGRVAEALTDRTASEQVIQAHVQLGLLLAALIGLRVLWRLGTRPPAPPPAEPAWRRRTSHGVHLGLYVLLLILPVSGFVVWDYFDEDLSLGLRLPDLFTPTEDETLRAGAWYVHAYAGWLLIALVSVHIAAALWHALVLRDGVLKRML